MTRWTVGLAWKATVSPCGESPKRSLRVETLRRTLRASWPFHWRKPPPALAYYYPRLERVKEIRERRRERVRESSEETIDHHEQDHGACDHPYLLSSASTADVEDRAFPSGLIATVGTVVLPYWKSDSERSGTKSRYQSAGFSSGSSPRSTATESTTTCQICLMTIVTSVRSDCLRMYSRS